MEEARCRALLRLAYLELPPRRLLSLLEHFEHPEAIFHASRHDLLRVDGMTESAAARILSAPRFPKKSGRGGCRAIHACSPGAMMAILPH